ncbi:MAG: hypothetical protein ACLTDS_12595, partial [Bianqueaceae bacterium]
MQAGVLVFPSQWTSILLLHSGQRTWYNFAMKTRLLSGGTWFCGETIVPEGLTGLQLSFSFTVRI